MPDQIIPPGPICGHAMRGGRVCVSPPGHADRHRGTRPARTKRTAEQNRQSSRRRRARARGEVIEPGEYLPDCAPAAARQVGQLPGDWSKRGTCRTDPDPDQWFSDDTRDQADAIVICRSCPVAAQCGAWALATGQLYGIWGGIPEGERRQLLRRERTAS
jgi:WhiB family redox-sensing transcriptional regulator